MKKIVLYGYDYLNAMNEDGLKEYIKQLEYYIYYQSGIIEEAWKSLFNEEVENMIERR